MENLLSRILRGLLAPVFAGRKAKQAVASDVPADALDAPEVDASDAMSPEVVELGDELDLHAFAPRDAASLVRDFVDDAAARGLREVRIIHGKGTGQLAATVHAVLARHPSVLRHALGGEGHGSWGATVVWLRARGDEP